MSCLEYVLGWFWNFVKIFLRVTPVLRPEEPLRPPYPFVTSQDISTALLTCYVSTCCNNDTLVFVSLRVSKFRFLGCIFGGAVLCIYYANEFSILPLFCSFCLVLSCLVLPLFYSFFFFSYFVILPLIRAIYPNMFRYFVPDSFSLLLCLWVK